MAHTDYNPIPYIRWQPPTSRHNLSHNPIPTSTSMTIPLVSHSSASPSTRLIICCGPTPSPSPTNNCTLITILQPHLLQYNSTSHPSQSPYPPPLPPPLPLTTPPPRHPGPFMTHSFRT